MPRNSPLRASLTCGLLAALCTVQFAVGQTPAATPPEAPAAPSASPPRVLETAEPVFPEAATVDAGHVVLALLIDETGAITETKVLESGGEEFDSAALAAAKRLRFEPARRDGRAVAARIPFTFDFVRTPPPPTVPVAVPVPTPVPIPQQKQPTEAPEDEPEELDVKGERPPREATTYVLNNDEIRKIPGTNGDLLRAVENLPGVGRPVALDGQLIVRGSGPDDTGAFLDGTWTIGAYHLGGITSVVPSELIERLDFRPGNFSPEHGRLIGGVVELELRSPRKDRPGGLLQIDLLDARAIFEGPITKTTRFAIAGRRSWLDAWLGPAAGDAVSVAPVYYDYQAMVEQDISKRVSARITAYGSDDRMKLLFAAPDASDPANGGDIGLHESFYRIQGRVDARLSDDVRWVNKLSWGRNIQQFNQNDYLADIDFNLWQLRSDLRWRIADQLALVGGADILWGSYDNRTRFPAETSAGNASGPVFARPTVDLHGVGSVQRPAGYVLAEARLGKNLLFTPGVRVDYMSDTTRWTVDPRIATRWDLSQGPGRTTLKVAAGLFHQAPNPNESLPPWGTPGIKSPYAEHYSAGFEQDFGGHFTLGTELFTKRLHDLVAAQGSNSAASGTLYANSGDGRAYGAEWLFKTTNTGRFTGWLAYTLSRSERRDRPSEAMALSQYDQTHILNVIGSYDLGRGWTVGGRFRYVSGRPYTTYTGSVADYDAGAYQPIRSTSPYDNRAAAFHRLDVRIQKLWDLDPLKLAAYLDCQNVYNHQSEEGVSYNYNFSRSTPLKGLPILPIIGVRGEL